MIVDSPFRGAYSPHNGRQIIKHDELKTMARAWKIASDWRPTTAQTQQFQATERAFAETFGVELPLAEMIPRRIRSFRADAGIYGELMERLGTQAVFVVVGYFKHAVVAAARQRRIPVHELQHSAITPYSLGYSYPGRPEVATSPDTVLCFGPFWTDPTEFPSNTTPRVIGRPRMVEAELEVASSGRARSW